MRKGKHIAEVENAEIFRDFETQYGTKDGILVKLTVKESFRTHKIMKRLFWSNHYTSMMMKFLNACFKNNVPDNMSIQQIAVYHVYWRIGRQLRFGHVQLYPDSVRKYS